MSVKEVTEQEAEFAGPAAVVREVCPVAVFNAVPNLDLLHESAVEEYEIWTPPMWTPLSLSPRSPRRSGCNSISASMSTSPATLRSVSQARLKDRMASGCLFDALSVIAAQDSSGDPWACALGT
ncbi:unnamed protein product [Cladocopium goreaui]|uniref:Uncharacterized protein n=1 Tax=Cladocopium goreaui TaxID=2562237 RepID=A0A9P1BFQ6_9DINO|nr:unnamed protein product [Cladocopium goreaui]